MSPLSAYLLGIVTVPIVFIGAWLALRQYGSDDDNDLDPIDDRTQ